jgi:hypothetical protein
MFLYSPTSIPMSYHKVFQWSASLKFLCFNNIKMLVKNEYHRVIDVTVCSLVDLLEKLPASCLTLKMQVPLKCSYTSTKLHSITTHNFTFMCEKTSTHKRIKICSVFVGLSFLDFRIFSALKHELN